MVQASSSEATAPGLSDEILGGGQVATACLENCSTTCGRGYAHPGRCRLVPFPPVTAIGDPKRRRGAGLGVPAWRLQGMAHVLGVVLGHPQAVLPETVPPAASRQNGPF